MEADHPTATDLFEEFLGKCGQIDEPTVNRALDKIRELFKEVDSSYRESQVFKIFLQKVIQKLMVNPWKSMKTVAEDLKYHTFQVVAESNQFSHNSDENVEPYKCSTFVPSIFDPESSPTVESGNQIGRYSSSTSEASIDVERSESIDSNDKVGLNESSSSVDGLSDEEDSRSLPGSSSNENNLNVKENHGSEIDEASRESYKSRVDDRAHNENDLNRFAEEDLLSKVDFWINKSKYDEAEYIHLTNLARIEKFEKIENLKMKLTKLNLDISKLGSREAPSLSDEIASLNKVRSLIGKYLEVHKKICKLNNETRGRDVIKFVGTKNVVIDRAIEKFYNEYDNKNLPLLDEICDVVRACSLLEESKVLEIATVVLQELGHIRHRQRADEFQNFISSYLSVESVRNPASLNPILQKKLSENDKLNQERMDLVINEYENRENIRMSRRSMARRRSSMILHSLVELDIGDFLRSMLFPSSDKEE